MKAANHIDGQKDADKKKTMQKSCTYLSNLRYYYTCNLTETECPSNIEQNINGISMMQNYIKLT